MVSALDSGWSGPVLRPDWGHCVVILDEKLDQQSASLHPSAEMGTGEFDAEG